MSDVNDFVKVAKHLIHIILIPLQIDNANSVDPCLGIQWHVSLYWRNVIISDN